MPVGPGRWPAVRCRAQLSQDGAIAARCIRGDGQVPRRLHGRRCRPGGAAWPAPRRRPGCSIPASRAWRPDGSGDRHGSRPAVPRPLKGRSGHSPASGCAPGSWGDSRCRSTSRRRRTRRRSGRPCCAPLGNSVPGLRSPQHAATRVAPITGGNRTWRAVTAQGSDPSAAGPGPGRAAGAWRRHPRPWRAPMPVCTKKWRSHCQVEPSAP